jgi:hypothetical protein
LGFYLKSQAAETLINRLILNFSMGVFDDIKDSIGDSESSGGSGSNLDSSSDLGSADSLDDNRFDDSFSNNQSEGGQTPPPGNQGMDQNTRQNSTGQNQRGRQSNSSNQGSRRDTGGNSAQRNRQNMQQDSSPNAQAGRPQQGSSEPQLSSQTRKKLDNAGLSDSSPPQNQRSQTRNAQRGQRAQQGNSTQSVAEGQDDLEQIKSQNRQIIELLKRINQSLNGSQGNL